MASCWQQLLLLLFVTLVLAEELQPDDGTQEDLKSDATAATAADGIVALHRTKRHDIEIHRVIKRRPKLPPGPGSRGRKPRPPRRPSSKPRVKYGPPNVNYAPLSHYVPQSIEDPFSSSFDSPFADHHHQQQQQQHHHHHGSFGEPPVSSSYSSSIHPSPTFGSPPFAYGGGSGGIGGPSSSIITSYEGSSFGKSPASYELLPTGPSFGSKPGGSFESSLSFGSSKPSYHGSSYGSHKPTTFDSTAFGGAGLSKTSFGNGPSVFDSKVPSFLDSPSSPTSGFDHLLTGSKPSGHGPAGGYSHSFTHPSSSSSLGGKLQPHFADSTAINTYTTPSGAGGKGSGSFYSEIGSFGLDANVKPQLPLETYKKDPYKTPLTSYEVPITNSKSNLFEPSHDFDTSAYKRTPHYGGVGGGGGVSSTHSTSHSTSDASEEYIPSLPTRYDQDQFHTPTKTNPNKPPGSGNTFPNLGSDNDPFTSFTSYYDGASESQKIPVKSQHQPTSFGSDGTSDGEQFPGSQAGGKGRIRTRRKKKPILPGPTIAHNLDTDDLRDAFGSSSDFHQVAIDPDEFLEFEPKKQIKHSKPAGVTLSRVGDTERAPSNFVLLSSQNKQSTIAGQSKDRQRSPPAATGNIATNGDDGSNRELGTNFFQTNAAGQGKGPQRSGTKSNVNDELNILSIQKSNSKSYYAGSSQATAGSGSVPVDLRPTRRRDMLHYRSAASLDYTMLDEDDDEENYDEISDIGTRYRGHRKKKELSEATTNPSVAA